MACSNIYIINGDTVQYILQKSSMDDQLPVIKDHFRAEMASWQEPS